MKTAYDLLERARKLAQDPDSGITIADLSRESGIHDPTLRNMLREGQKNRTLDNLGELEKALEKLAPEQPDKAEVPVSGENKD